MGSESNKGGFTPGPWTIEDNGPPGVSVVGSDGLYLCRVERWNAHLIAASPEMYEALTNMVGLWAGRSRDDTEQLALKLARAALARAEGLSDGQ